MEDYLEVKSEKSADFERICILKYKWTVNNMHSRTKIIKSSIFSSGLHDFNDEWCICIDPGSNNHPLSIILHLKSVNQLPGLLANAKYSILDSESLEAFKSSITDTKKVVSDLVFDFQEGKQLTRTFLLNEENDCLPKKNLTILFEIRLMLNRLEKEKKKTPLKVLDNERHLVNDMAQAFESGEFSDVILMVEKKSFKVMKGILAARSSVFAEIFHTTPKNEKNEILISGINVEVFRELLFFIYTDTAPNVKKMPFELLLAAEKYQLTRLRNMCEKSIINIMNSKNVIGFFEFAVGNSAKILEKQCIEFIKNNLIDVVQSQQFQSMKTSKSITFALILEGIAKIQLTA